MRKRLSFAGSAGIICIGLRAERSAGTVSDEGGSGKALPGDERVTREPSRFGLRELLYSSIHRSLAQSEQKSAEELTVAQSAI
jgi:hypothetical protein